MNYYIELSLHDTSQKSLYSLWTDVYTQIHLALVESKNDGIGVSFPEYHFNEQNGMGFIGSKMRIFAEEHSSLKQLKVEQRLKDLVDYVVVEPIQIVPKEILGFACYQRIQPKTSIDRLVRRRIRRGTATNFDETVKKYAQDIALKEQKAKPPFIQINSQSNKNLFKLFIQKKSASFEIKGKFGSYGLGNNITVPEF
jgi:CRISPR-associated endonuclease Csy4